MGKIGAWLLWSLGLRGRSGLRGRYRRSLICCQGDLVIRIVERDSRDWNGVDEVKKLENPVETGELYYYKIIVFVFQNASRHDPNSIQVSENAVCHAYLSPSPFRLKYSQSRRIILCVSQHILQPIIRVALLGPPFRLLLLALLGHLFPSFFVIFV
jgi:hypothetical protein